MPHRHRSARFWPTAVAVMALAAPGLALAQPAFPGVATAAKPIAQPGFAKPADAAPPYLGPLLPSGIYRLEIQWPANGFHNPQPSILVTQALQLTHSDPAHLPPNMLAPLQLEFIAYYSGSSAVFSQTSIMIGDFSPSGGVRLRSGSLAGLTLVLDGPTVGGGASGDAVLSAAFGGDPPQHATFTLKPASQAATSAKAGQLTWTVDQLFAAIQSCRHPSC